jgi:hypothetical protein
MTKKEIIQMAEKAGITISGEAIFRLCQLIEEKEREACAKCCDVFADDEYATGKFLAMVIRARGQE